MVPHSCWPSFGIIASIFKSFLPEIYQVSKAVIKITPVHIQVFISTKELGNHATRSLKLNETPALCSFESFAMRGMEASLEEI